MEPNTLKQATNVREEKSNALSTLASLENEEKRKKIGLIHRAYLTQLQNARVYTASTKTKSEVRGGGRKPWRQKGTGNARAGSIRSPLWVGGGVIFGPKPHSCSRKINKKERRLAILAALSFRKSNTFYYEGNSFPGFFEKSSNSFVKTKEILQTFSQILGSKENHKEQKILLILPQPNRSIWLASRNLKNVEVTSANCLNVRQLLHCQTIILSTQCREIIMSTYG